MGDMSDSHVCTNCHGIQPETCIYNVRPSPYCSPYLTRRQTEEIWRLLHAQPQKRWEPHRKNLLKALRQYAGSKHYGDKP